MRHTLSDGPRSALPAACPSDSWMAPWERPRISRRHPPPAESHNAACLIGAPAPQISCDPNLPYLRLTARDWAQRLQQSFSSLDSVLVHRNSQASSNCRLSGAPSRGAPASNGFADGHLLSSYLLSGHLLSIFYLAIFCLAIFLPISGRSQVCAS